MALRMCPECGEAVSEHAASCPHCAREAYVHGEYARAIELAKPLTDSEPARAWRLIGASACFEKDRAAAGRAYAELDETGRRFLKYVCSRNSIRLP
jgi:hypothetical protein